MCAGGCAAGGGVGEALGGAGSGKDESRSGPLSPTALRVEKLMWGLKCHRELRLCGKRDVRLCQKRIVSTAKESCDYGQRDLRSIVKQNSVCGKRDLWQKRSTDTWQKNKKSTDTGKPDGLCCILLQYTS